MALSRPAAADPALLLQVAAIASATPWTALDHLVVADRAPAAIAGVPGPGSSPVVPGEAPQVPATVVTMAAHGRPGGSSALIAAAPAAVAASTVAARAATIARDRLTLSPATAALRGDPQAASGRPGAAFMLDLLAGLTGEAPECLQLLAFGAPGEVDDAVAGPALRGPGEWLQLLVRGTVHGTDARQLDVTLGLSVQRQSGATLLDGVALESLRASLEQLARSPAELDYPGPAAALAGHSARFQAVLDPAGLWPMQSFILSGLLILGGAREDDELPDDGGDDEDLDPGPQDEGRDGEAAARTPLPPPKRRRAKPAAALPASLLPADGGPPIITASHWLSLELRHWRTQLRQWMQLPALAPSAPTPG